MPELPDSPGPWLVVGLGNPGPEYVANRHNVGHLVLDVLAERAHSGFKRGVKGRADIVETRIGEQRVVLAKPRSYMNESAGPVVAARDFFKVSLDRLVVVHDELDLGFGVLRLKRGGGDNGHNGLRSLTKALGPDYLRVRFGIGRPPGRQDPAVFVLRDFSSAEQKELDVELDRAADAVDVLVRQGLEAAQNAFNS